MTSSASEKPKTASGIAVSAEPLREADRDRALEFLARRPVHTVIMAGWIRAHGVVHPQHRGTFYRTLDQRGSISGIAMIGRHTCFEVASSAALKAFAVRACKTSDVKMVFGEAARMAEFWRHYGPKNKSFGDGSEVLLFENRDPPPASEAASDIRPANLTELDQIVTAHAQMTLEETGTDPLKTDADGFRSRCARRIEERHVWVRMCDGELVFKTDIVSETPQAIYIEGLWINPKHRGRKIGRACIQGFCRRVLTGSNAVCGFVAVENVAARSLYSRSGFEVQQKYSRFYA
jgi:uncharacterized protein